MRTSHFHLHGDYLGKANTTERSSHGSFVTAGPTVRIALDFPTARLLSASLPIPCFSSISAGAPLNVSGGLAYRSVLQPCWRCRWTTVLTNATKARCCRRRTRVHWRHVCYLVSSVQHNTSHGSMPALPFTAALQLPHLPTPRRPRVPRPVLSCRSSAFRSSST